MVEKTLGYLVRTEFTLLELSDKVAAVEVVDLLPVAKDNVSLASQCLRQVRTTELRHVVVNDELERADVVSLCLQHLAQYTHQRPIPYTQHRSALHTPSRNRFSYKANNSSCAMFKSHGK